MYNHEPGLTPAAPLTLLPLVTAPLPVGQVSSALPGIFLIFSLEWQLLAPCERGEFAGILWVRHSGRLSTAEKPAETLLTEGEES